MRRFICWGQFVSMLFCQLGRAHTLRFDPGTIVVDDRGYNDYGLFCKWSEQGVYFATRMKDNAVNV